MSNTHRRLYINSCLAGFVVDNTRHAAVAEERRTISKTLRRHLQHLKGHELQAFARLQRKAPRTGPASSFETPHPPKKANHLFLQEKNTVPVSSDVNIVLGHHPNVAPADRVLGDVPREGDGGTLGAGVRLSPRFVSTRLKWDSSRRTYGGSVDLLEFAVLREA